MTRRPLPKIHEQTRRLTSLLRERGVDRTMSDTLAMLVDVYESCGEPLFEKVEEAKQRDNGKTAQTKRLTSILRSRGISRPMDETMRKLVDAYEDLGEGLFILCPAEEPRETTQRR